MIDSVLTELDTLIRESAKRADLPDDAVLGWDGASWRWIWAVTTSQAVGEVRFTVTPLVQADSAARIAEGSFAVASLVRSLDRAFDAWSRVYLSGQIWELEHGSSTPESPRTALLVQALRLAWSELDFRIHRGEFPSNTREEAIARFRRYLDEARQE